MAGNPTSTGGWLGEYGCDYGSDLASYFSTPPPMIQSAHYASALGGSVGQRHFLKHHAHTHIHSGGRGMYHSHTGSGIGSMLAGLASRALMGLRAIGPQIARAAPGLAQSFVQGAITGQPPQNDASAMSAPAGAGIKRMRV